MYIKLHREPERIAVITQRVPTGITTLVVSDDKAADVLRVWLRYQTVHRASDLVTRSLSRQSQQRFAQSPPPLSQEELSDDDESQDELESQDDDSK